MFTALFTFLTAVFQSKKPHVIVIVLTILFSVGYYVYANMDNRVTKLEFTQLSVTEKLNTLNEGQNRIEKGVDNTREEVSQLKNLLIRRNR